MARFSVNLPFKIFNRSFVAIGTIMKVFFYFANLEFWRNYMHDYGSAAFHSRVHLLVFGNEIAPYLFS